MFESDLRLVVKRQLDLVSGSKKQVEACDAKHNSELLQDTTIQQTIENRLSHFQQLEAFRINQLAYAMIKEACHCISFTTTVHTGNFGCVLTGKRDDVVDVQFFAQRCNDNNISYVCERRFVHVFFMLVMLRNWLSLFRLQITTSSNKSEQQLVDLFDQNLHSALQLMTIVESKFA